MVSTLSHLGFLFLSQVSKLVILHEDAEDGNAMPDLARPVQVVKMAVDNLIKVRHVSGISGIFLTKQVGLQSCLPV